MIFFKKKLPTDIEPIINQIIGGQSVIFRMCKEILKLLEDDIRKIDITYFCLSVVSHSYLNSVINTEWKDFAKLVLDKVTVNVLRKSITSCGEKISLKEAEEEYIKKYNEYSELIEPYFEDKYMGIVGYRRNSDNPRMKRDENNISNLKELALIFYNSVNKNAKKESIPPMLLISGTVALFSTYIDDNFAFCNTLLNN